MSDFDKPGIPKAESASRPMGFEEEGAALASEADGAGADCKRGHVLIRSYLTTLDDSPGVYRMLDDKGRLLYVGKARSLRKRVANYANPHGHTTRILRMIHATAAMIFVTTQTESEALLLEANLIKRLKPRYNVLLRDDKSFPHIFIGAGAFPQLAKHRGLKSKEGAYFGPFASVGAVNRTMSQLQKAFLLRTCADSYFANRTRPCLLHQIRRCAAPCVGHVSAEEYAALTADAKRFLDGRSTRVQADLAAQMTAASVEMNYERAAVLRDRIRALTEIQRHQGVNPQTVTEADVIALHVDGGQSCIQVFFFRSGQNWGNRAYFPRIALDSEPVEILEAFICQFYSTKTPPRALLLSHEAENHALLVEALSAIAGRKVAITAPRRGEKRQLVEHALTNARESLGRRMAESATQKRLLAGLAEAFDLDAPPQRIEVYDNSHIQGANAVGAMIVAGPEGLMKSQYRKFNIRSTDLAPGDDFGMMREVLTRRFARLLRVDPDREKGLWPDLALIDGGAGQLSVAREVMAELGVSEVALFGVAKGEDRDQGKEVFHAPGRRPFALPHRDPTLYFIQRLRDEAHRFAIGAHRARRAKATTATPLDEIPGVGPTRKRALLRHFGSAKAVSRAGLCDLEAVDGVSKAVAKRIYEFFHGER